MAQPGGRLISPDGAPVPDFAALLATLPVALIVVDPADRIAQVNAEAEALLNLSKRLMVGQSLTAVFRPPHHREAGERQGFNAYDAELEIVRGGRLMVDYMESKVADFPGWRMIALHNAGTPRRISQSVDRAAAGRAAIGAAAMLAHEIKNPLSGIRGAAQLLANGNAANDELTVLITTEVDRIAALIDRMQDFTDTRPLTITAENIYPLLDHARRVALAGFARDVLIEERYDPSLPAVAIDRDATLQILLNLLKNAAEAIGSQPDGRILLTTAFRHGMAVSPAPGRPRQALPIEICVIDNGAGPPSDIADHLFDPFVSGKPKGQGLGLALVDKLVRDMGGIVQVAREGAPIMTVFRVMLPRGRA